MATLLTAISSMATRRILSELAEAYVLRSGIGATFEAVGGIEAARRVRAGEPYDLVVLASGAMARLEAEGHLLKDSCRAIASSGMAAAIREGTPRPAFTTEADVRQALTRAGRIGYSTGPSGDHLRSLVQRWGLSEFLDDRLVQSPAGVPVASLVAEGDADLGFQQLSELLGAPGIEILASLPHAIQATTGFTAGITVTCQACEPTRALIRFLASEEADAVKRRYGMEPADSMNQ